METHTIESDTANDAPPEPTARELARQYADEARALDRRGRELTQQLRVAEHELDRARAALGSAFTDGAPETAKAKHHERIERAKEEIEGIKAAIAEVEQRAEAFRSGAKDERLKATLVEEEEALAIAHRCADDEHALIVDFVHELFGPIDLERRRAGQRANVARSEANTLQRATPNTTASLPWDGSTRYPDLDRVAKTLLEYAGNRTHQQQRLDGAQMLQRIAEAQRQGANAPFVVADLGAAGQ